MRLAISNIAWDVVEDEAIVNLLRRVGIDAIDIAPGKYFSDPSSASDGDISRVKNWWLERGIEITGMQALLFGTTGLNVFGLPEAQEAMLRHLGSVCRIGAGLGAKRLVFGSPRNRDRIGLSDQQAMDVAIPFFRQLGGIAEDNDVLICLEPNPICYGANFMTNSADTMQVVKAVAHSAVRMQLDTGALAINSESPAIVLEACSSYIGHVHASEPDLLPLGDGMVDHENIGVAVEQYLPNHVVSIEMLATKKESHEISVERALRAAIKFYRHEEIGGSR